MSEAAEAGRFNHALMVANVGFTNLFWPWRDSGGGKSGQRSQASGVGSGELADCNSRKQLRGAMPVIDSGASGGCRAAATQQECPAATPRLENGICQPSNCAANEIFTGSVCRTRQASDCTGNTPILDGGICRAARNNAECRAKNPSLGNSSGRCVEVDTSFSAVYVVEVDAGGGARHDHIAFATNQPSFGAAESEARRLCNALTEGTVTEACKPLVIPTPNNECIDLRRAVTNDGNLKFAFGRGATPALAVQNREANRGNIEGGFASWRTPGGSDSEAFCDCGGSIGSVAVPKPGDTTGSGTTCRARVSADCGQGTPIFDGGICRAATIADCTTAKPILDGGACRELRAVDCTGATPIFANNACRPAVDQNECTNLKGSRYVYAGGGVCRERTKADCSAAAPVLDDTTKQCRARVASDCTGFTPALINGVCQPGTYGAVAIGTVALNISPVNFGALTNPAHPQYSTANGTIQVYGVSRLQASAADARRLALSACGRAASDHSAAVAGQTGQDCQTVSEFSGGIAALWRLATAPYGDHYFSGIATLQINTTIAVATLTTAQATTTTTMTLVVAPTDAEIAAAQAAAETAAKTACDTFAAAQTSAGQTLECQNAAVEVLRTIPAAEVCGEGAFLDTAAIPSACACLPGYDTLVAGATGLPSCSLSANTPRCDNSRGAFLNADADCLRLLVGLGGFGCNGDSASLRRARMRRAERVFKSDFGAVRVRPGIRQFAAFCGCKRQCGVYLHSDNAPHLPRRPRSLL